MHGETLKIAFMLFFYIGYQQVEI